ncbi:hypothetical protein B0H16DRAFT_1886597 [Mycena metata]|uniref:Uncharacterized protein n=1 Tax=Mycena metata TaxID=1033252 RepID=A0AAD7NC39_9AGAR|nr:hypothetical protein B0H16DRAFT_1886597 [Mycena metata]
MASQSNYPDFESDIADHQLGCDDDALPPRPTSRLSFNGEVAVAQTVPPTRPRAVSWTKNLFHKIRIPLRVVPDIDMVDMDITAVSPDADDDDLDPVSLPILPSSTSMDVDDDYDDSDSDGYSSGDSDIDLDSPVEYGVLIFPPVPKSLPPPPSPPTPTPSARRTKYSTLPSPLSPAAQPSICRTTPLRHAYGHHGRSRHALLHLKFLWALREDAHENNNKNAYAAMRARLACNNNNTASPPPMTIHPRSGDLSALRDPYPAHMDRCFGGMPLWTMGKTLWMYDVHLGVAAGARSVCATQDERDEESESDEESILAASVSGASDDSDDSTLVGSGSEGEVDLIDLGGEVEVEVVEVAEKKALPRSRAASVSPSPAESKPQLQPQHKAYSKRAPPPKPRPVWETSWYKRWEVLLELVRIDAERERVSRAERKSSAFPPNGPTAAPAPASASKALAVRAPRFFIGEPDDEDDEEGDESWSEERWDEVLGVEMGVGVEDDMIIVSHSAWC